MADHHTGTPKSTSYKIIKQQTNQTIKNSSKTCLKYYTMCPTIPLPRHWSNEVVFGLLFQSVDNAEYGGQKFEQFP